MKKTLVTFIISISLIIFEHSFTEAYEVTVPKWLEGEVLEVCTVTQDVKINQRWEENNGAWIKDSPIFLKEGDLLTVHKSKSKTIKKWYNSSNGRFPVRSTSFHKVTLDKDYGKLKNKEVGKKKVKDIIEDCKKPEIKTASTNKKTKDFSKNTDFVTIPQADIDRAYKYEQIILVTVACSKDKRGNPKWHDTFIGIINVNTFQGTRSWRSNSGYEIFNGFKNKDNFIIKVDGRYSDKSDRWNYKFLSKGTLSIRDHLKKGIETFRGKDKSRRKCKIQSAANDIIVPVRESMRAFYAKDKKSIDSEKISKLETDLSKTKKEKNVLQKTIKELKDEINKINLETVNKNDKKIKAEEEKKQKEIKIDNPKYKLGSSDLIVAQNLINDVEEFIKNNPDEFDVIKIFELLVANKKIKDGIWGENSRENYQKLSDFVNNSVAFRSYHLAKEEERFENAMSATNE